MSLHISTGKHLVLAAIIVLATSLILLGINQDSFAHRSGCHRWHSCPSDSGSYTCGDLGYDTYCPKNAEPKKEIKKQTAFSSTTKSAECKGTKLCINGTVRKIIDGDTLLVGKYTVRLSLTDTPERGENGFKEATSFTKKLCTLASNALVDQDDGQPFDKYGRMVGKVTCSGKVLNAELLDNRHANISTQFCKKSEFSSESWAKKYGC
jgi:endonuclease YncB( thermonuclease family)